MNWQPIETAPKDGSHILAAVHYPAGGKSRGVWATLYVYWDPEFQEYPDGVWALDYENPITSGKPTYWMPVPLYVDHETKTS